MIKTYGVHLCKPMVSGGTRTDWKHLMQDKSHIDDSVTILDPWYRKPSLELTAFRMVV